MTIRWEPTALPDLWHYQQPGRKPEALLREASGWWHYGNGIGSGVTGGPYCSLEVAKRKAKAWRAKRQC